MRPLPKGDFNSYKIPSEPYQFLETHAWRRGRETLQISVEMKNAGISMPSESVPAFYLKKLMQLPAAAAAFSF